MALWLNESDVRACLTLPAVMQAMEAALAAFSTGRIVQPVRTSVDLRERAFIALMPAYDRESSVLGTKLVSVVPENAACGLATHLATISLVSGETGELLAVMDGRLITEMRTAAVSAVSVKYLARPGASSLAILGSGVQARSHVEALREFEDVRAWSPNSQHLAEFAEEAGVRAADSAEEAVREADIVVLATNSVTPVLADEWVRPGAHVISLGAARPSQREIAPDLMVRARLVVDSRAAAVVESGDIVQAIAEGRIAADDARLELGEVISGAKGRRSDDEVTLFKSLGLAVEDLATAVLAYRAARECGRGTELK